MIFGWARLPALISMARNLRPRAHGSVKKAIAPENFRAAKFDGLPRRGFPGFQISHQPSPYRLYWFFIFSSCRSSPSWMSRSIRSEYFSPEAAHSLGYMLMAVKPGIVLISFT